MKHRYFFGAFFMFIFAFVFIQTANAASLAPKDTRLVKAVGDSRIYAVTAEGKRHLIRTAAIFNSYRYNWRSVRSLSKKELDRIPFIHLATLKGDSTIWWVNDLRGLKKPHMSEAALASYNNRAIDAAVMTKEDLDAYRNVQLIKEADSPNVYMLEGDKKRLIVTEQAFVRQGFSWGDIVTVSHADAESYMTGSLLDEAAERVIEEVKPKPIVTPEPTVPPAQQRIVVSVESEPTNQTPVPINALRRFMTLTIKNQSNKPVPIDSLILHQTGLSKDSDVGDIVITNIDGSVLGGTGRLSDRVVTFRFFGDALQIPASGTRTIQARAVMVESAQMGLSIDSSADIGTPASVSGAFPLRSPIVNSIAGDFLPAVKVTSETLPGAGLKVSVGSIDKPVASFRLENQSDTDRASLTRLRLGFRGNAVLNDIRNIRLVDSKNKVLATIASLQDRSLVFDLSSAPVPIGSRSSVTVTVKVDIASGEGRTLLFSVDTKTDAVFTTDNGSYQFYAADTKFPVGGEQDSKGNTVAIIGGNVVIAPNVKSPTGATVVGAKTAVLAVFDVKAGETALEWTGGSVRVRQQGPHALDGTITIREQGKTVPLASFSSRGIADAPQHFFVQRTPILAKKILVLEVVGSVSIDADVTDAYTASLSDMEFAVKGSSTTFTIADEVMAYPIGVKVSTVQASINGTFVDGDTAGGMIHVRIASFTLKNSAAQSIRVKEIAFADRSGFDSIDNSNGLYRLEALIGSKSVGEIAAPSGGRYAFQVSDVILKSDASAIVDVYVDSISASNGKRISLVLDRLVAEGETTEAPSRVYGVPVQGQAITLYTPSITFERVDSDVATTVAIGKAVRIARFALQASKAETVPIADITIGESPDSVALSSVQGITALSLRRVDTNKQIGGNKALPIAGGNILTGFSLKPGERIVVDVVADLASGVVGKTIQVMVQDARATGSITKKTPPFIGMPLRLQTINVRP